MIVISLISFLGISLFFEKKIASASSLALPLTSSFIILTLYIAGLLGILYFYTIFLLLIGFFLFLSELKLRSSQYNLNFESSSPYVFFIFALVVLFFLTQTPRYSNFSGVDDFSHWGRVLRVIVENNRLTEANDPIQFPDYPLGTALFNYFFLFFGGFTKSGAMFAQGILILSLLSTIYGLFSKIFIYKFPIIIFIFSLIYFFKSGFHTLSVDLSLGLFFGLSMTSYYLIRENTERCKILIFIFPLIAVMTLLKLTGIYFALTALAIVGIDLFLIKSKNFSTYKKISIILLFYLFIFLIYFSWKFYLLSEGLGKTFSLSITFSNIIEAFNPNLSNDTQKLTIENFITKVFFPYKLSFYRPYYWLVICSLIVYSILKFNDRRSNLPCLAMLSVLFLAMVGYLFLLLLLYIFSFGSYEGPQLASIDRYFDSYFIGLLFLLIGMLIYTNNNSKKSPKKIHTISYLLLLLVALPSFNRGTNDLFKSFLLIENQNANEILHAADFIKSKTSINPTVFFIHQHSYGTEKTIFDFEIIPGKINNICWSVYDKVDIGDVWSCKLTIDEFINMLVDYEYIYLHKIDNKFIKNYGILFENKNLRNGTLFKIIQNKDKVSFVYVDEFRPSNSIF